MKHLDRTSNMYLRFELNIIALDLWICEHYLLNGSIMLYYFVYPRVCECALFSNQEDYVSLTATHKLLTHSLAILINLSAVIACISKIISLTLTQHNNQNNSFDAN